MKFLNKGLLLLSFLCLLLMLKSSEEKLLLDSAGLLFQQFKLGNEIVFNLSCGMLISIWFYFLVVWLPEQKNKKRVKTYFISQYAEFKRHLIMNIVGACREPDSADLIDNLMDPLAFKVYFKEKVTGNQERWHVFLNNIDKNLLVDILNEFEAFKEATYYLLGSVQVDDDEVFSFLHRINTISITFKGVSVEGDSLKQLSRLLWEMLAGFSGIDGYRDYDYFDKMFRKI
ncbi:TPA: hypothetical protein I7264_04110 [Vibrio parahaemolyticus]|uniref:hypothetical protein n=2 Tax=Vibrio parahaemolyticus TaxID=670 RepID=UPI001A262AEF|nr:hypothetical protein [Vibrio parahaemolyticus]EHK0843056.1 hypothetical protein [Vibrio parahaemolyticus]EII3137605.1 hypothetical protein [Vibrio parahaemolyticus]EJB8406840.1 hypothetical protein [Vibrio parahaemolyticus]EJB8534587.1 hypothetical protein [Vibrio parahaemolyticus]EJG1689026.1 hypothetical protein [Vibrio parahaemolyticus]